MIDFFSAVILLCSNDPEAHAIVDRATKEAQRVVDDFWDAREAAEKPAKLEGR